VYRFICTTESMYVVWCCRLICGTPAYVCGVVQCTGYYVAHQFICMWCDAVYRLCDTESYVCGVVLQVNMWHTSLCMWGSVQVNMWHTSLCMWCSVQVNMWHTSLHMWCGAVYRLICGTPVYICGVVQFTG